MNSELRRFLIALAGVALVVGFFMPWLDVRPYGVVSGWDLVEDRFGLLPNVTRLVLALCPLGGATLALSAFTGSAAMESLSLLMGLAIPGYAAYKTFLYIGDVVGIGLLLVIIASAVALVAGVLKRGEETS